MEAVMSREKTFNMRLSDEEAARFERVAAHYALPVASMIRMIVKEKDAQIARDTAELKAGFKAAGSKADEHQIARFARIRARAKTEEETGASFAFPSFIRASLAEAARGGSGGYEEVGYKAATGVFRRELEGSGEAAEAALGQLLENPRLDVLEWMRQYFPRIFEKVPAPRRDAFARGIKRALEEGEV